MIYQFHFSITECVVIWFGIVLVILPSVEVLHFAIFEYKEWEIQMKDRHNTGLLGCVSKLPVIVIELYRILGYFFIGALGCLLTTELAKYKIGRLRPYYLTGKYSNNYCVYSESYIADFGYFCELFSNLVLSLFHFSV